MENLGAVASVMLQHPRNESELQSLLASAPAGARVRVIGSLHSEKGSVKPDGGDPQWTIALDLMTDVADVDSRTGLVDAQAGASLGGDPQAIGAQSDASRSVCQRMAAQQLALPITGGITHQTLSGFMSTGADGGSLTHSFWSAVEEFTLIDGLGQRHVFGRTNPNFYAAAVSLGLLGVITSVRLRPERAFDILGMYSVQPERTCDFKLFEDPGAGTQTLVDFLQAKPYARALWWPQPGVERVELWEAERYDPERHAGLIAGRQLPNRLPGLSAPPQQLVVRALFGLLDELDEGEPAATAAMQTLQALAQHDLGPLLSRIEILHGQLKSSTLARFGWQSFETVRQQVEVLFSAAPPSVPLSPATPGSAAVIQTEYSPPDEQNGPWEQLVASIIENFVRLAPTAPSPWYDPTGFSRGHCLQLFRDAWHTGLPMDNDVDDDVLPVTFTELWLPLAHAPAALRALRDLFRRERLAKTGTFCIELYGAKQNPAWLSMAHDGPMLRVDPFFCETGDTAERNAFFKGFWDTLLPFGARAHWAKALPPADPARQHRLYPKLAEFLELRAKFDPKGLFLTDYWRTQFGLG